MGLSERDAVQLPESRFLTVGKLASYLGVSKKTIYFWVEEKRIPYVRVGRMVFFELDDIEAWIAQCRVKPAPVPCTPSPSRTSAPE